MQYSVVINVDIEQDGSVAISLESCFNIEQTIQVLQRSIELLEERSEPVTLTS